MPQPVLFINVKVTHLCKKSEWIRMKFGIGTYLIFITRFKITMVFSRILPLNQNLRKLTL